MRKRPTDFGLSGNLWDGKTLAAHIERAYGVTLGGQPGQVGVQVAAGVPILSGTIAIDGASQRSFTSAAGTTIGHWVPTYRPVASGGTYTVTWAWVPATKAADKPTATTEHKMLMFFI